MDLRYVFAPAVSPLSFFFLVCLLLSPSTQAQVFNGNSPPASGTFTEDVVGSVSIFSVGEEPPYRLGEGTVEPVDGGSITARFESRDFCFSLDGDPCTYVDVEQGIVITLDNPELVLGLSINSSAPAEFNLTGIDAVGEIVLNHAETLVDYRQRLVYSTDRPLLMLIVESAEPFSLRFLRTYKVRDFVRVEQSVGAFQPFFDDSSFDDVFADPLNGGVAYLLRDAELYVTRDFGQTVEPFPGPWQGAKALTVDKSGSHRITVTADNGVWSTSDRGSSWSLVASVPGLVAYGVDGRLFVTQDEAVLRSEDGGLLGVGSFPEAPDSLAFQPPATIFGVSDNGVYQLDETTGVVSVTPEWSSTPPGNFLVLDDATFGVVGGQYWRSRSPGVGQPALPLNDPFTDPHVVRTGQDAFGRDLLVGLNGSSIVTLRDLEVETFDAMADFASVSGHLGTDFYGLDAAGRAGVVRDAGPLEPAVPGERRYDIEYVRRGFHVASLRVPQGGQDGAWSIVTDSAIRFGINFGAWLPADGMHPATISSFWPGGSLPLVLNEYLGREVELDVRVFAEDEDGERALVGEVLSAPIDEIIFIDIPGSGSVTVEVNSRSGAPETRIGIRYLGGGILPMGSTFGGWIKPGQDGAFFGVFQDGYAFTLHYGESFASMGASEPVVETRYLTPERSRIVVPDNPVLDLQSLPLARALDESGNQLFSDDTAWTISADGQFAAMERFGAAPQVFRLEDGRLIPCCLAAFSDDARGGPVRFVDSQTLVTAGTEETGPSLIFLDLATESATTIAFPDAANVVEVLGFDASASGEKILVFGQVDPDMRRILVYERGLDRWTTIAETTLLAGELFRRFSMANDGSSVTWLLNPIGINQELAVFDLGGGVDFVPLALPKTYPFSAVARSVDADTNARWLIEVSENHPLSTGVREAPWFYEADSGQWTNIPIQLFGLPETPRYINSSLSADGLSVLFDVVTIGSNPVLTTTRKRRNVTVLGSVANTALSQLATTRFSQARFSGNLPFIVGRDAIQPEDTNGRTDLYFPLDTGQGPAGE